MKDSMVRRQVTIEILTLTVVYSEYSFRTMEGIYILLYIGCVVRLLTKVRDMYLSPRVGHILASMNLA
jgi:hypothetical protein